ncbi:hypothetical protein DDB_G0282449 [Dictyostelium discoideum AX4]|uniref:Uncharacterized protein n=1 Tax=Dictyostelium discoideum TaxID=44689 RepID=Q54SI4_DICDI|nr:hypothetical protein DDB_G0282449 [Dictyostelium discoideum AX4]EAL66084.1 hypothetical protein DDB_G0282449 [Dictyostelium discoideum AX4]|eukprot:XP_640055.1 hypothetical protein DDB_G0282449 [Dictyostelium discoideum AX4]
MIKICNNNNRLIIKDVFKNIITSFNINIYSVNNNNYNNNKKRFYGKSRNIFDDDDDEEEYGETIENIQAKRDHEYRMRNNQPFKGKYHSSVVEDLTKKKISKNSYRPVKFTDEDWEIILDQELESHQNKMERNFLNEDITVEEESSIKPVILKSKNEDIIEDDKFSYKDLTDEGFELLLKEIFKNKRTGECDLDEEDLIEIKKMLVASTSLNVVLDAMESSKNPNNLNINRNKDE